VIRIEHVRLPPGMTAFARRENRVVIVQVSTELSAGERLTAIREALRAAPDAGWRSGRHPVLIPALAGGAGLRWAPEGRWTYWVLLTAAVGVAASVVMLMMLHGAGAARHSAAGPPGALAPGSRPGSRLSPGPDQTSSTGRVRSSGPPGTAPGRPAKRKVGPGAPVPQVSGTPVPAPTPGGAPSPRPAPQPSGAPTPASWPSPSPRPSPSPASSPASGPSPSPSASGGSPGVCVDVLGITICV
jgi:hypothetical protein